MSYTKREWATGNVVGAVDLNRMEQGIEDSRRILVVNSVYNEDDSSYTLDKTWQEIYDAFPFVIICNNTNNVINKDIIINIGFENDNYFVDSLATSSASGYPSTPTGGLTPVEPSPGGGLNR